MGMFAGVGAVVGGTDKTILTLISAATVRPELREVVIGCSDTPADQAARFSIMRFTAVGTEASGFTPTAWNPADPAGIADVGVGVFSAEPTYTANSDMLWIAINQRGPFRWIAQPGRGIIAPATASNGLGLRCKSATSVTPSWACTLAWEE